MEIRRLQIIGFRSIKQADLTFQSGMNLLVGVNGVGKTTVLDALRVCLSRVLPAITASQSKRISVPPVSLMNAGEESMQFSCDLTLNGKDFNVLIRKQRVNRIVNQEGTDMTVADTDAVTPELSVLFPNSKNASQQPLGLFFSARRSLVVDKEITKASSVGGQAAAFADSLASNRELNLRFIAQWMLVQQTLGNENPVALKHIDALQTAMSQFLPHFQNLRVTETDEGSVLEVDKLGVPLRINQLSEGERGVLAIVSDLARRLSQANPSLEDPVKDGAAVVLIDELDLHLHPKWQRSIVENLTRTFPNCQFIATTHSPQIIGEVAPERVQLIKDNQVIHPDRTLGMDTNWILRHLMETDDRPDDAVEAIQRIEKLIGEGNYEEARDEMAAYRQKGLDLPEWSMLEARIARFELVDTE